MLRGDSLRPLRLPQRYQRYTVSHSVHSVAVTTPPSKTHASSYDASCRVQSKTEGTRGTVAYTYTPDDRPATMTISGGLTTTYAYYGDGSLDSIDWSPVTGKFKHAFTLAGQYQTIAFPNGQTRSYGNDDQMGYVVRQWRAWGLASGCELAVCDDDPRVSVSHASSCPFDIRGEG